MVASASVSIRQPSDGRDVKRKERTRAVAVCVHTDARGSRWRVARALLLVYNLVAGEIRDSSGVEHGPPRQVSGGTP